MLSGRPMTSPATARAATASASAARSFANLLRRIVAAGEAKAQPASQ
jgi:hypothetical protein